MYMLSIMAHNRGLISLRKMEFAIKIHTVKSGWSNVSIEES